MSTKVMLLIDADNVSVDLIEQGVERLLAEYGALHVRRAYCTAESALKNQQAFKRLGIRPMVNLAAGKNSTDIALAVDALDLVLSERPDVVVIASSDSDFAPLVGRLREKGCRVRGIGQQGKTGAETLQVYDDFLVLTHRGDEATPPAKAPVARRRAPARRAPPASKASLAAPMPASMPTAAPAAPAASAAVAAPTDEPAAARVPSSRSGRGRRARRQAEPAAPPAPGNHPHRSAPPTPRPQLPERVVAVLAALPELRGGQAVELRVAAERLRDAELLGPRASSTKFFAPLAEHFDLLPADQPNKLRWRGAA